MPRGGKRPGSGRKKGSVNVLPRELKEMILSTLHEAGGEDYLLNIAKTDPKTFAQLLGKVLPLTVAGDPNEPLKTVTTIELVGVASANSKD